MMYSHRSRFFVFLLACLGGMCLAMAAMGQSLDPRLQRAVPPSTYLNAGADQAAATVFSSPTPWQKLDAQARILLTQYEQAGKRGEALSLLHEAAPVSARLDATGQVQLDLFVQLTDPAAAGRLEALGFERQTQVGDIVIGQASLEVLRRMAEAPFVRYVETSKRSKLHTDVGRVEIRADQVHLGTGLPRAYQGEGVIVGVLDSGIDFTHPDFSDNSGTRIQRLIETTNASGNFREWTKQDIDTNPDGVTQRDDHDPSGGHGTHVAGTAAGGGRLNPAFRGIAPRADIIFGKLDIERGFMNNTNVVAGSQYIFQQAAQMGKPAVINLSLGGHGGPQDGTSLYEQAMADLTGPGRIIVVAAGNEGNDPIHAGGTITAGRLALTMLLAGSKELALANLWYDPGSVNQVRLDAWGVDANNQLVQLGSTDWVAVGQSINQTPLQANDGSGSTLGFVTIDAQTTQDPNNGGGNVFFSVENGDQAAIDVSQTFWMVAMQGNAAGRVDLWALSESIFYPQPLGFNDATELPGDTEQTVGEPATASRMVAVGSYVTKNQWIDVDGGQHQWTGIYNENPQVGPLSIFSSKGPSRDGRTLPTIAAPGERIAAPLSSHLTIGAQDGVQQSDVLQGGKYHMLQGTSMASPHVAGVVALMLQANPSLTPEQVIQVLQQTARADGQTSTLPNNQFGAGKIDALAAVQQVAGSGGGGGGGGTLDPPTNLTASVENGAVVLSWSAPGGGGGGGGTQTTELAFDDGSFEQFLGFNENPGELAMGPFVPPTYPATLRTIRFLGNAAGQQVRLKLYVDAAGTAVAPAGNQLAGSVGPVAIAGGNTFQEVDVSALGVTVAQGGRFFVGIEQTGTINMSIALDEQGPSGKLFFDSEVDGSFNTLTNFNGVLGIRAVVEVPANGLMSMQTVAAYKAVEGHAGPASGRYTGQQPELALRPHRVVVVDERHRARRFDTRISHRDGGARSAAPLLVHASGAAIDEIEPNNTPEQAQRLSGSSPLVVQGSAATDDNGGIVIRYNDGSEDDIEDLFRITTTQPGLTLTLSGFSSDCDLFLWDAATGENKGNSASTGATAEERIELAELAAGEYLVGVTIYDLAPGGGPQTSYALSLSGSFGGGGGGGGGAAVLQAINVYRSTTSPVALSALNRVGSAAASANTFVDNSVTARLTYYYVITAAYDQGESNASNEVQITVSTQVGNEDPEDLPMRFALLPNYPNPFNPQTRVSFELPSRSQVRLMVYDILGREVARLVDEERGPGRYQVHWDAHGVSSGTYFCRLEAGSYRETRAMTVLK